MWLTSRSLPTTAVENMNYSSCLSRQGAEFMRPTGELTTCTEVLNIIHRPSANNDSVLRKPQADVWWYCGKGNLHKNCPATGLEYNSHRARRAVAGSFDSKIYINSIGVPRGVPNEFKAQNQIAAGFESALF
ncbi:hypothetical protein QTO34_018142 [Cnephaeus nilssonii]|uniref:Uncharacterized protein n=1 Tax=Cnephaeus nilssonii TaxID=3371016 RepID=A0AA40HY97_CNENI|nr:hypothetical protein QTO34_018142 [Eptesicus nilssonii]